MKLLIDMNLSPRQQHETALDEGALLTLDPIKARVRVLPLK